ncbi:MAG: D-alanine--D-alanine ligase [Lentisphaerae bacterium]|nr:D-alanine--D-alanine ligase [Lentisphaerota bacterium]
MTSIINLLRSEIEGLKILEKRSYKELTSLGVGSAVLPAMIEPENEEQLVEVLKILARKKFPFFLFGAGTNLVGSDKPLQAVGLRLAGKYFSRVAINGEDVNCGAYARLPLLAALCGKAGLGGLAPLSGIPGTIGGALRMNAGANGVEIGSLVKEVRGFYSDGKPYHVQGSEIEWLYRGSSIPANVIITEAVFSLKESSSALEEEEICRETERRRKREPAGRTAGCAFRNVSDLDPAGKLIDQCGLRGLRVGDLVVSPVHANYILNMGEASEADYLEIVRIIRRAVSAKHGFYLIPEIISVNPELNALISDDTPAPKVNLLCGGISSEREVSLAGGEVVTRALRKAGFKVEKSDIRSCDVTPSMRDADVVYPLLHGGFGEDGTLQKVLEGESIRFVGSGSASSQLVMDKIATKKLLDRIALPTAAWGTVSRHARQLPAHLDFPVILKAPCEGSSVGIVKVNSAIEWETALDEEFKYADELLVESFITGTEISIPVLNGEVLEAIEIVAPSGFYDYNYKYHSNETQYFMPPRELPEAVIALAKDYALKFYHAAGCRDILRVDFIVDGDGVPRILEGNNLPGNTDHSLVPKAARHAGISMEKMVAMMVYCAMKRSGEPPLTRAVEKESRAGRFFRRFFNILFNAAAFAGGGVLVYAGKFRHEGTPAVLLMAGGLLLAIYGLCRQFDRR